MSLLLLLVSFIPLNQPAQAQSTLPPVDMFQLPWDYGIAWVAIDGFDDGSDRPPGSSHNYRLGGAVDFAPRATMFTGEDTSNFWVTAAGAGTVTERSNCHLKITHSGGWITEYQFLGNIQVQLGNTVARNQRLGIIADGIRYRYCAGYVEPNVPHLHFTLRPTLVGATFAGWQFKYNSFWNTTTFAKDGRIVTLYKPLLNVFDQSGPTPTPTLVATTTPGTPQPTSTVDPFATATATLPGQFTNTPDPFATATPTPFGQFTNTPDPSQPTATATAGGPVTLTPDVQQTATQASIQTATAIAQLSATPTPVGQITNTPFPSTSHTPTPFGQFTNTPDPLASATPTPFGGPFVSTTVNSSSLIVGETTLATVTLHNVPASGYTSAEFTCTFDPTRVEASNVQITTLFGTDAVAAINVPQAGEFIVAIAGTNGNKATTSGAVFNFNVKALQAGQTTLDCTARVSTGNATLTPLPSSGSDLVILSLTPTPTWTPTSVFATPTSPTNDWLTFTNLTYNFQFKYPPQGQLLSGNTDTYARINLPFASGTNLSEKYLEVIVGENVTECKSPLQTQDLGTTVTINGISFLKQTGVEGAAGSLYQWVAYSTLKDNVCVSLDFVLHSHNPGNFSTPPPVFDFAAESAVFGQIVDTYRWLSQGPTATPTPVFTATPGGFETPGPTATPVASLTPTSLPTGTLNGQVLASKPVMISLYRADDTLAASVSANVDGTFTLTVPLGTYKVVATASGFLSAEASVNITGGNVTTLETINLSAGDIDNNNIINQFDALTIGMSYNTSTPSAADLNNDGIINVLDLEALAKNYRKTGPIPWDNDLG